MARTEDQILKDIRGISDQRAALREKALRLWQELGLVRAQQSLDGMPEEQRAALLRVVAAKGLQSDEAVQ